MNTNWDPIALESAAGMTVVVLVAWWTLAVTLMWLWIAWRAMRAHENLAEAVGRLAGDAGRK